MKKNKERYEMRMFAAGQHPSADVGHTGAAKKMKKNKENRGISGHEMRIILLCVRVCVRA
jgi:hypothetical protein